MALKEYPAAIAAFQAARDAFAKRAEELAHKRFETDSARADRIRLLKEKIRNTTATNRFEVGQVQEWEAEVAQLESSQESGQRASQPAGPRSRLQRIFPPATSDSNGSIARHRGSAQACAAHHLAVVLSHRPSRGGEGQLKLATKSGFKPPAGLEADIEAALAKAPKP